MDPNKSSKKYSNIQSVKDSICVYSQLYRETMYDDFLLDIFNEIYDIKNINYSDFKQLLNVGHFYAIEKDDIRKALYYYDKVTKLNSSLGLYSLALYYFSKNVMSRAKMYALNGVSLNGYCLKCTLLLTKISIKEKKDECDTENCFLECLNYQKTHLVNKTEIICLLEQLCLFYLELKDSVKLFKYCYELSRLSFQSGQVIKCRHYLDLYDFDMLGECAQELISVDSIIGHYFMGMLNYKKMMKSCVEKTMDTVHLLELIDVSQIFFETVIGSELNNIQTIKEQSQKVIEILEMFRSKIVL